ncbi:hypothetical protein DU504_07360 [Haloplanus salinus]|uniref:Uncharacterized protein n=1 Tax=Haloplanus salinus TaxID=1126245 RepID=A0A368NAT2_9EURY|nr:hypothetical protein DU504_07360 [Haloplanus salinus]
MSVLACRKRPDARPVTTRTIDVVTAPGRPATGSLAAGVGTLARFVVTSSAGPGGTDVGWTAGLADAAHARL